MKKLLILLLIGICGLAWRSEDLMKLVGLAHPSGDVSRFQGSPQQPPRGMTMNEFAELARKDPDAYRKFFASHQATTERNPADKLMNFFAHGKYE
ncbi:hypothetical protein [Propionivibrio dicarboxylicus]|nr:hypothetical protein [Propionivibrio dicarboxylicus]